MTISWQELNKTKRQRRQDLKEWEGKIREAEEHAKRKHHDPSARAILTAANIDLQAWLDLVSPDGKPDPHRDPDRYQWWRGSISYLADWYQREVNGLPRLLAKAKATAVIRKLLSKLSQVEPVNTDALLGYLSAQGKADDATRCPACGVLYSDAPPEHQRQIDHILPIKRGGLTRLSNLGFLCRACNAKKGLDTWSRMTGKPISSDDAMVV